MFLSRGYPEPPTHYIKHMIRVKTYGGYTSIVIVDPQTLGGALVEDIVPVVCFGVVARVAVFRACRFYLAPFKRYPFFTAKRYFSG